MVARRTTGPAYSTTGRAGRGSTPTNVSLGGSGLRGRSSNQPLDLYQQQLDAVNTQPKPAKLTQYATTPQYQQALPEMQALYDQLAALEQQGTAQNAAFNAQMQTLLSAGLGAEQTQAIMDMLHPEQRQSTSVYLYGY